MSTATTYRIESSSSDATFDLGERLGKLCRGGEVFALSSDLGGGKTTFAKGLAAGFDSKDIVSSPTFTVSQVYDARDGLQIHHFDFYRLQEAGVVGYELEEVIDDPKAVIIIEWGDIVEDVLPPRRVLVTFDRVAENEDRRSITFNVPEEAGHLRGALA